METARLWFARLVVLYGVLIFSFLAWNYIANPLDNIAMFGSSATGSPESIAFFRVTAGALFLGQALVALWGLVFPSNLLNSLKIIVLFLGCTVVMRLFGRDPMERRMLPEAESYWVEPRAQRPSKSYFKQF